MNLKRGMVALLALWTVTTFAITATEKSALQSQVEAAKAGFDAVKATIDALPVEAPQPPPAAAWPRTIPDVLDIDLVNQDSILKARLIDGSPGISTGMAGVGSAIHYGDMTGPVTSWQPFNIDGKLSNPSCPPRWGVEANGLHYLESCTDGTKEPVPQYGCATCRLIFWNFHYLKPAQEYFFRYMVWLDPITYANDTELGIKQAGLAGDQIELGPTALTDPTREVGKLGWELQTYRYGYESGLGYGVVEKLGLRLLPGRWYTIEQHDRVNTVTNGVANKDGLIEVKVDGVLLWARNNVQQYGPGQVPQITSLLVQSYHGGLKKPAGILRERHARIAICKSTWCGPAPEVALGISP